MESSPKESGKEELPPIPAKRYFTIGEVSELCGVKPHVLRYWEQEFTQLRPVKRRGNRRYYQHHEVLLVRRIRELLYNQGFTISGARNRLEEGHGATESVESTVPAAPTSSSEKTGPRPVFSFPAFLFLLVSPFFRFQRRIIPVVDCGRENNPYKIGCPTMSCPYCRHRIDSLIP